MGDSMRVILLASTNLHSYWKDGVEPTALKHMGYVDHPRTDRVTASDELGEAAGRLCYLSNGRPNPDTATNEGYLANIIAQRHFSVLEHASASFYIDGVSRNFSHELIRHRHLSFSEVSQRYVDVGAFSFIGHPGLAEIDDAAKAAQDDVLSKARAAYNRMVAFLTSAAPNGLGLSRKEARQASRSILPCLLYTS